MDADFLFTIICQCDNSYAAELEKCPNCQLSIREKKNLLFDIPIFLDKIYTHQQLDKQDTVDLVFDVYYHLYNRFDLMIEIYNQIDITKISSTLMVSFLCQTFKYIKQVPNHLIFLEQAKNQLRKNGDSEERINKLFMGFGSDNKYWESMEKLGAPAWLTGPKP